MNNNRLAAAYTPGNLQEYTHLPSHLTNLELAFH